MACTCEFPPGEGHKASKKKVKEEQIAGVTKVVGLSKLRYGISGIREGFDGGRLLWKQQSKGTYHPDLFRTKYESHEAKRKLCNSYDLFLADERVLGSLPKLIGEWLDALCARRQALAFALPGMS